MTHNFSSFAWMRACNYWIVHWSGWCSFSVFRAGRVLTLCVVVEFRYFHFQLWGFIDMNGGDCVDTTVSRPSFETHRWYCLISGSFHPHWESNVWLRKASHYNAEWSLWRGINYTLHDQDLLFLNKVLVNTYSLDSSWGSYNFHKCFTHYSKSCASSYFLCSFNWKSSVSLSIELPFNDLNMITTDQIRNFDRNRVEQRDETRRWAHL